MSVRIRPGERSDEAAMQTVFRSAGRAAWPHILGARTLANLKMPARWVNVANAGPERALLVAETEERVVGFCVVIPDSEGQFAEIDSFYTHPEVWGLGYGRALMKASTDFVRSTGLQEARLWTAVENHRPRRFYESAGWTLTGEKRTRVMDGVEFVEVRYSILLPAERAI